MAQLGLIPMTKRTKRQGEGVCRIERGPRKGRPVSCKRWGGKWRQRKPICKSKTDTNCRRPHKKHGKGKVTQGCKFVCREGRGSDVRKRCWKVCRNSQGKISSMHRADGQCKAYHRRTGKPCGWK